MQNGRPLVVHKKIFYLTELRQPSKRVLEAVLSTKSSEHDHIIIIIIIIIPSSLKIDLLQPLVQSKCQITRSIFLLPILNILNTCDNIQDERSQARVHLGITASNFVFLEVARNHHNLRRDLNNILPRLYLPRLKV